jgi:hypothetical protein
VRHRFRGLAWTRKLFLLIGLLTGLFLSAQRPAGPILAIAHVAVIDPAEANIRKDMTVLVVDGKIRSISSSDTTKLPDHAVVLDGSKRYLIPGLWDMHVHTANPKREFPMFIANGVLGVRNMHGRMENVSNWRTQTAEGHWIGPQLKIAGTLVDGPSTTSRTAAVVRNDTEAREAVRRLRDAQVDFIKAYDGLSREAYFALADESKRLQVPFVGHIPWDVRELEAVRAGQKSLEHGAALASGSLREDEVIQSRAVRIAIDDAMRTKTNFPAVTDAIARSGNAILDGYNQAKAHAAFRELAQRGCYLTPTLVTLRSITFLDDLTKQPDPLIRYSPKWQQNAWKPEAGILTANRTPSYIVYRKREYAATEKALVIARNEGVSILAGTDVGSPYTHAGFSLHDELSWLVKAGLTPREALQSATTNAAAFFQLERGVGTITPGSEASVILLDENPLQDIANVRRIHAVVLKGKLFRRDELNEMLRGAELEAAAGR